MRKVVPIIAISVVSLAAVRAALWYFLKTDSPMLMRGADATTQMLYYKMLLSDLIHQGQSLFWSWQYGIGGDVYGQFAYYYSTSLTFYLTTFLTGASTITTLATQHMYVLIIQMVIASLFTYALFTYRGNSFVAASFGAIMYSTSFVFIQYGLTLDFMVEAFVLLPVVLLGLEITVRRKIAFPFILTMALALLNFYFGYITTLFVMCYAIFLFFDTQTVTTWRNFIRYALHLSLYYVCSLALAAIAFIPAVYQYLQSDRHGQEAKYALFFSWDFYFQLPKTLFLSYQEADAMLLPLITGVLMICLLMTKQPKRYKYFLMVLIVMICIPYMYSVFNGFAAMQRRWFYGVYLGIALLSAETMTRVRPIQWQPYLIASMSLLVWLIIVLLVSDQTITAVNMKLLVIGIGSMIALGGYWLVQTKRWRIGFASALLLLLFAHSTLQAHFYFTRVLGDASTYQTLSREFLQLPGYDNKITQEVAQLIQQRTQGIQRTIWADDAIPDNASFYYPYYSNSTYQSLIPLNIHQYYKEHSQTLQSGSVSRYANYDERLYQELWMANRFQVIKDRARHIPYHHQAMATLGEWTIYEAKETLPVGFAIPADQWLTTSEAEQLTSAAFDQAIWQAVIVHNNDQKLQQGSSNFDPSKLVTATKKVAMTDIELTNITMTDASHITVGEAGGQLRIPLPQNPTVGEYHLQMELMKAEEKSYIVKVLDKSFHYLGQSNPWHYLKKDYTFNLGHNYDKPYIDVHLIKGQYELRNIATHFNSYEPLPALLQARNAHALTNSTVQDTGLTGTMAVNEPSIAIFSIPYSKGWQALVNGEEVPLHEVNYSFIGIPLTEGEHEIELIYRTPYFDQARLITLLAFFILITGTIYQIWYKRNLKNKENS